jgi:hypothetical protein
MSSIVKRSLPTDPAGPADDRAVPRDSRQVIRVWRPLFSTLIAVVTAVFLSGSVCIAVYCTEDCDPCLLQTCKCSTCAHHTSNFESSHRLDAYDLALVADAKDQVTRVYANILGLSLDRALGAKPHSEDDLAKFARDVLTVNGDLFGPGTSAGRWVLDGVERFGSSRVATFHASDAGELVIEDGASISFLFDGRGNLVEIDHSLR